MAAAGNRALAVRALSLCHAGGVPGWAGDIHRLVLVTLTMADPMRAELPPRVVIRHGRLDLERAKGPHLSSGFLSAYHWAYGAAGFSAYDFIG